MQLTRYHKFKENYVGKTLCTWVELSDVLGGVDRRIAGGFSLRRPDIFIPLLTHIIIVEVDENQHYGKAYQEDEELRNFEISLDVKVLYRL